MINKKEKAVMTLLLAQGSEVFFRVTGESMSPLIEPDDRVAVRAVDPSELALGDLIVINCLDSYVTHRFYNLKGRGASFRHKGDRGATLEPLAAEQIVGKVHKIRKGNGRTILLETSFRRVSNRVIGLYQLALAGLSLTTKRPVVSAVLRRPVPPSSRRLFFNLLASPADFLVRISLLITRTKRV